MKRGPEALTGILSIERLKATPGCPSVERLAKGPVACIECVEDIPCNPCEKACPFGAIRVGTPITNLPALDETKCTGCGQCLAICPGLAIWLLDATYSDTEAIVAMPYEYLPLPSKGDAVHALNRAGEKVCDAQVRRVRKTQKADGTAIVTVVVPKEHVMEVRTMRRRQGASSFEPTKQE